MQTMKHETRSGHMHDMYKKCSPTVQMIFFTSERLRVKSWRMQSLWQWRVFRVRLGTRILCYRSTTVRTTLLKRTGQKLQECMYMHCNRYG